MSLKLWQNDTDKEKREVLSNKNGSQGHYVRHKYHTDEQETEAGPPRIGRHRDDYVLCKATGSCN